MSVGSADVIVAIRDVIKKGKDKMGWEISEKHEVTLSFKTTEKLLSFLESNEKELKNVELTNTHGQAHGFPPMAIERFIL